MSEAPSSRQVQAIFGRRPIVPDPEHEKAMTARPIAIPLVDLRAQIAPLRADLDAAIASIVDDAAFILGPGVARFEAAFAAYVGTRHCVGVQSGTAALQLALLALGVGPGDEVITVPLSFIATAEAISLTGARPVFVDVEPDTLTLDASRLGAALTARTRAVVPVHLFGQAADLPAIQAIAERHGVPILEDACQAHGATCGPRRLGSVGAAGCFSFYPGKNLGAFGEAGAVTTDDGAIAERVRRLRDHGSPARYVHERIGFNYRMEGLQGAVLAVKLPHLDGWNARRRAVAARYDTRLAGVGDLVLPVAHPRGTPVFHLYAVRTSRRDVVLARFAERSIARAIHYPTPIHLQPAYAHLGHGPGAFPVAEEAARRLLSLPLFPELTPEQQDVVVEAIGAAFR
jgi:dTDP-4-amino-4,6-dideoxygalactose transaminase